MCENTWKARENEGMELKPHVHSESTLQMVEKVRESRKAKHAARFAEAEKSKSNCVIQKDNAPKLILKDNAPKLIQKIPPKMARRAIQKGELTDCQLLKMKPKALRKQYPNKTGASGDALVKLLRQWRREGKDLDLWQRRVLLIQDRRTKKANAKKKIVTKRLEDNAKKW